MPLFFLSIGSYGKRSVQIQLKKICIYPYKFNSLNQMSTIINSWMTLPLLYMSCILTLLYTLQKSNIMPTNLKDISINPFNIYI